MSDRITNQMLDNAMEYLAEQLAVAYVPRYTSTHEPRPGDITYEAYGGRAGRYQFGIYRYQSVYGQDYESDPVGGRHLGMLYSGSYECFTKRELHDRVRFMANVIYLHRAVVARAQQMGDYDR